ncbi:hypothetical protein M3Y97_00746000 [Aphelenchoides bicaudatus]|nr:hypothetical protein M3Y97_00746000 [Aphelenchoides bicaudatus]
MANMLLSGSVLIVMVQVCASFYQMPYSFQRYMDDRSFLRPGSPLPIAAFMPAPNVILVDEEPIPQPLPTPVPLRMPESVPRRALRQFAGETHQFKRMRPCFYSPIQCLMKRSANDQADPQPEASQSKTSE